MDKERLEIPVWEKMTLTVEEAAAYSNIGIRTLQDKLREPGCPFVIKIGNRKLVKRKAFEKYIEQNIRL